MKTKYHITITIISALLMFFVAGCATTTRIGNLQADCSPGIISPSICIASALASRSEAAAAVLKEDQRDVAGTVTAKLLGDDKLIVAQYPISGPGLLSITAPVAASVGAAAMMGPLGLAKIRPSQTTNINKSTGGSSAGASTGTISSVSNPTTSVRNSGGNTSNVATSTGSSATGGISTAQGGYANAAGGAATNSNSLENTSVSASVSLAGSSSIAASQSNNSNTVSNDVDNTNANINQQEANLNAVQGNIQETNVPVDNSNTTNVDNIGDGGHDHSDNGWHGDNPKRNNDW